MTETHDKIEFSRNLWSFSFYFFVVFGIIGLTLYILIFILHLLNSWIFICLFVIFLVLVISLLVFSFYIGLSGEYYVNSLKNQQFPQDLNSDNQDHDAFIIIHSMSGNSMLYSGLDILIRSFVSKKYPFKIYHCYNPEDFKNALKNEKAKYIWIFGHGWRGGISFKWTKKLSHPLTPNKTNFSYKKIQDDLEKYPKKLFIGQFHCNNIVRTIPDSISLPEILLELSSNSAYYVTNWKINQNAVWIAIRKLVKDVKRDGIPVITDEK